MKRRQRATGGGYQPTPDDLALEELIDETRRRFRSATTPRERREAVREYRELVGQRRTEAQEAA